MKTKLFLTIIAITTILLNLQSCCKHDPIVIDNSNITISYNDMIFSAINIIGDDTLLAKSSIVTDTENWGINIIENGKTTTISGTKKNNELPVRVGDEIEITFPPYSEETKVTFTMPDGTICNVTTEKPSFKWKVPVNFTAGMKIKGENLIENNEHIQISHTGIITLIKLEDNKSK